MIGLPRLLNGDMTLKHTLHPEKTGISRNAFALSAASITLPDGEPPVKSRDWIRLYDRYGTAGIFRVSRVRSAYGSQTSLTLKHGFCVLGDDTVKESEGTLTGTAEQIIRQLWAKTGVTEAPRYWTFGSFAQTPVITYEYSNPKLLTAVYDVLKKIPGYDFAFDQSVFPWVFSLVKLSDADACEGRFGRNLDSCTVDVDDSALCTRVYLDERDGYTDADTVNEWGVVSETLSVPDGADDAAVQEYVRAYLRDHGEPYVSITLSGVDMSQATGESIDRFEAGRICRACLADYGATVRSRIVTVETPDVYGRPDDVRVIMANRANTASDLLAKLRSSTNTLSDQANVTNRRLSATATSLRDTHRELVELDGKTTDRFSEVAITLDAQSARIDLMATREELSEVDYTLNQVAISLDAAKAEIEMRATTETTDKLADRLTGAEVTLKVQSEQIEAKASQYEVDALGNRVAIAESTLTVQAGMIESKVSKDGVISSINQTAEAIRIQANKINLSGYVTMSEFEAEIANIEKIFAGSAILEGLGISGTLLTTNLDVSSNLKIFGSYAQWEEIRLYRGGTISVSQSTTRNVYDAGGNTIGYVTVPTAWSFSPSSNGTYNFLTQAS